MYLFGDMRQHENTCKGEGNSMSFESDPPVNSSSFVS